MTHLIADASRLGRRKSVSRQHHCPSFATCPKCGCIDVVQSNRGARRLILHRTQEERLHRLIRCGLDQRHTIENSRILVHVIGREPPYDAEDQVSGACNLARQSAPVYAPFSVTEAGRHAFALAHVSLCPPTPHLCVTVGAPDPRWCENQLRRPFVTCASKRWIRYRDCNSAGADHLGGGPTHRERCKGDDSQEA